MPMPVNEELIQFHVGIGVSLMSELRNPTMPNITIESGTVMESVHGVAQVFMTDKK